MSMTTSVFSFRSPQLSFSSTIASAHPGTLHSHFRPNRVLSIPELLSLIFSFSTPSSNAISACVCKTWSDIALRVLWSEVSNLDNLIGLLVPLRKRRDLRYVSL